MDATGWIALAMAIAIGLSAIGSGIGQGIATGRATESMARQPEMAGGIRTTLILGLAFMETLTIYGLLIALMLYSQLSSKNLLHYHKVETPPENAAQGGHTNGCNWIDRTCYGNRNWFISYRLWYWSGYCYWSCH